MLNWILVGFKDGTLKILDGDDLKLELYHAVADIRIEDETRYYELCHIRIGDHEDDIPRNKLGPIHKAKII